MHDFLSQTFYGNTILQWAIAFGIMIATLIVAKTAYWICGGILRRLTAKTATKLDDLLLDMVEEPLVLAITIGGVWYALSTLHFSEKVQGWLGRGLEFVLVLAVTWCVARVLDALFQEYLAPLAEKSETDLDDLLLPIVRRATHLAVWSIGIIVALNNAGYNVGALLAGLGIGGIALAMAAQDTVSNVFGGLTVFTDQPFKLNDRVRVAGFDGFIREIGLRSTRLQTLDGTIVTIPNKTFAGTPVENITLEPSRKVVLNLGLTYDTTPEAVEHAMKILDEIASEHASLEPTSLISFNGFGDFALNVLFIYYIRSGEDILKTQSEVDLAILRRFNEAGLDFAFPTQTILTQPAG